MIVAFLVVVDVGLYGVAEGPLGGMSGVALELAHAVVEEPLEEGVAGGGEVEVLDDHAVLVAEDVGVHGGLQRDHQHVFAAATAATAAVLFVHHNLTVGTTNKERNQRICILIRLQRPISLTHSLTD